MIQKTQISESESHVLEALWRVAPSTADAIVKDIAADKNWTAATVKTLLNRLLKKGAVQADRDGRRYLYSPLLSREDYIQTESQGLLNRLFDGQVAPLVSHFSQRQALSNDDIAALKKLVRELDNDH